MGYKKKNVDYEVGYKRPPKHSQFKKRQSGNPGGRPKKATPTISDTLGRVLSRRITVTEDGHARQLPAAEVVFVNLMMKALTGEPRAVRELVRLMERYETQVPEAYDTTDYGAEVRRKLDLMAERFAQQKKQEESQGERPGPLNT